ncbi:MAG TPA: YceI family protein [Acidobacteriaceae bacterium]|nr:YceI family protein [Acidobacteriaceae bacterium]
MSELYTTVNGAASVKSTQNRKPATKRRLHQALRTAVVSIACLIAAAVAVPAFAQTTYAINPAKSQVQFSLSGFHEVAGHFAVSSGSITFNRTTGVMSGKVEVAAASGNSGETSRDKKMDKDQLKVKKYPAISFTPAKFTGTLNKTGSSTVQVEGTFTLLGKPHAITLPMTVDINGTGCTAKGSFVIPYVKWGVKDPSNFLLHMDKQVKIDLAFDGTLSN